MPIDRKNFFTDFFSDPVNGPGNLFLKCRFIPAAQVEFNMDFRKLYPKSQLDFRKAGIKTSQAVTGG